MDPRKIEKILRRCQDQTEKLEGGKSDFAYHNTRNSLHNIWTELGDKNDEKINEINACLKKLEAKAQENERRKFLNYYAGTREVDRGGMKNGKGVPDGN
ncbi:hypothetical protein Zmor_022870 [Zophobas morio]|uniref:Uncharacterized protein n=1 Tax=Zophobas morio TaxID=2755281 RepID=A0AA38HWB6_9CUCU|nr:hypothetical protein Zmor_022870 [Zophobas morio]